MFLLAWRCLWNVNVSILEGFNHGVDNCLPKGLPVSSQHLKGLVLVLIQSKRILASEGQDVFLELEVNAGCLSILLLRLEFTGGKPKVFGVVQ